ncbi:uncharacterized protein [Dermacentor andersoni]|uniref:uncharacterized protein n=1 Tax=Dermacentor andersoni TaxID=34620 RepID=UPI0024167BCE|nr:uncharacterized protein LOC129386418 [Dermacentor andersoni]
MAQQLMYLVQAADADEQEEKEQEIAIDKHHRDADRRSSLSPHSHPIAAMQPRNLCKRSDTQVFRPAQGESSKSSQKEDRDDDRRYMVSLLFLCLIGVVPGALASGLVTALLIASQPTVPAPKNGVSPPTNGSTANPLVCNTNDCKLLAQWLRVKVDQTVDPCDDFYQFVCDDYKRLPLLTKTQFDVEQISRYAAYASNVPATGQTAWQKAVALIKACLTAIDSKLDETKELTAWMTSLGLDLNNLNSSEPFEPVDMVVRFSLDIGVPILLAFSFGDVAMVNNKRLMSGTLSPATKSHPPPPPGAGAPGPSKRGSTPPGHPTEKSPSRQGPPAFPTSHPPPTGL